LEVIIKGTDVVGTLQPVPSQHLKPGKNLFDPTIQEELDDQSNCQILQKPTEEQDLPKAIEEAEKAAAEAEAAALEAKRKAEKMEMLKKRAEAAMARRKTKIQQQNE